MALLLCNGHLRVNDLPIKKLQSKDLRNVTETRLSQKVALSKVVLQALSRSDLNIRSFVSAHISDPALAVGTMCPALTVSRCLPAVTCPLLNRQNNGDQQWAALP